MKNTPRYKQAVEQRQKNYNELWELDRDLHSNMAKLDAAKIKLPRLLKRKDFEAYRLRSISSFTVHLFTFSEKEKLEFEAYCNHICLDLDFGTLESFLEFLMTETYILEPELSQILDTPVEAIIFNTLSDGFRAVSNVLNDAKLEFEDHDFTKEDFFQIENKLSILLRESLKLYFPIVFMSAFRRYWNRYCLGVMLDNLDKLT